MWNTNKYEQLYVPTANLQCISADTVLYSVEVIIAIHYIIYSLK